MEQERLFRSCNVEMTMPEDKMKWRLPDNWTVIQSDGRRVTIDVSQDGNTLVGTAYGGSGDPSAERTGTMSGSVVGDTISLTIYWPDKTIVEFNGTVSGDGSTEGTTFSQPDSAPSGGWHAEPALSPWE